jgi:acetyl esterase
MPIETGCARILAARGGGGEPPAVESVPESAAEASGGFPIEAIRRAAAVPAAKFGLPQAPLYQERALTIRGRGGPIPIRVYWPRKLERDERRPIMVFLHGGMWAFCSMDTHENMCRYLCLHGGAIGISVGYRLAPEHKFPAGLEDCADVLKWAGDNADTLGGDRERIAVAGDSAGGNLAAVLALMSREQTVPPIAAQLLFYPSVAFGVRPRTDSWVKFCTNEYISDERDVEQLVSLYVHSEKEFTDVRISPILATDFAGVPAALIITAEYDPLRDEGERYASLLEADGVPVDHKRFDGAIHDFMNLGGGTALGVQGLDYAAAFLRRTLGCMHRPSL